MIRFLRTSSESMWFVIGVACLLLVGAWIFPMRVSLAQGVDERIATDWVGVLNHTTGAEYYRMDFNDGSFLQVPITGLAQTAFTVHSSSGDLHTKKDLIAVIQTAFKEHPKQVEKTLGTYQNAASLFHPFTEQPIAYDVSFLMELTALHINPKQFGGPDIPPGTLNMSNLHTELHVDTKADGNTLYQCKPGQKPAVVVAMMTHKS